MKYLNKEYSSLWLINAALVAEGLAFILGGFEKNGDLFGGVYQGCGTYTSTTPSLIVSIAGILAALALLIRVIKSKKTDHIVGASIFLILVIAAAAAAWINANFTLCF